MSISLPLWLILVPYGVIVAVVAVIALLSLHHLNHYGASSWISTLATFSFLLGASLILLATASMLQGTDWSAAVSFAPTFGESSPMLPDASRLLP